MGHALLFLVLSFGGAVSQVGQPPSSAEPPKLLSGSILPEDYPAEAVREGAEGRVRVQLLVGADGKVSSCLVVASSGSTALDNASCALSAQRFTFSPAVDEVGERVSATYTLSIDWALMEEELVPFAANRHVLTARRVDGAIVDCSVASLKPLPAPPPVELTCPGSVEGVAGDGVIELALLVEPGGASLPLHEPYRVTMRMEVKVEEDGSVSGCRNLLPELVGSPPPRSCTLLLGSKVFEAAPGAGLRSATLTRAVRTDLLLRPF